MYQPPFHRRILPWIFTVVFLLTAPALVFYTAGYRWNTKKYKVERNGTLIIDSKPTDAKVILNGVDIQETTPITLQNTSPGRYLIRLEKENYYAWEKELDVQAQYVTFANNIRLWKIAQPQFIEAVSSSVIEVSPNQKYFVIGSLADRMDFEIRSAANNLLKKFSIESNSISEPHITWSEDSRSFLIENHSSSGTGAWLENIRTGSEPISLPRGSYTWNHSLLDGISVNGELSIKPDDGTVMQAPLAKGVLDTFGDILIQHATGTDNYVLFKDNKPDRGLILPSGTWFAIAENDNELILKNGSDWLSVDPDATSPTIRRVQGDRLRPYVENRKASYILLNGGEIWLWNTENEPELLLRQSRNITEALWHSNGKDVIVANETTLSVLNLDQRDGRINTTLAEFEKIDDFALLEKSIYILGTKDGKTGLWTLEIE